MTIPIRIQRKRSKGFGLQAVSRAANGLDCVYVGRPTRWGNPYGLSRNPDPAEMMAAVRWYTRKIIADWFPAHIYSIQHHLRNKNLACWCPHDQPCHADVLLVAANPECFPEQYNQWFGGRSL